MSSNGSNSQPDDEAWQLLVGRYADAVWQEIQDASLPEPAAVDVNRLTWMRLADHIDELQADAIESWLRATARRESARSTRLLRCESPSDRVG